jgi:hypothetical protein
MYYDQIHPFSTLIPPFLNNINQFRYSIFIHAYEVLQ